MKNQKIKKILYTSALIGSAILLVVSVVYFLSVIINFRADLSEFYTSFISAQDKDRVRHRAAFRRLQYRTLSESSDGIFSFSVSSGNPPAEVI